MALEEEIMAELLETPGQTDKQLRVKFNVSN